MPHHVQRHATAEAFRAAAANFLVAREAENNLVFGIVSTVLASPEQFDEAPRFATVTDADGMVVAATLRTPPWNQVLSWTDDLEAIDALVESLADETLPGVLGPSEASARFAQRWTARTGKEAHRQSAERIFSASRVVPPDPAASGSWRQLAARDRDLLGEWIVAFAVEATPAAPRPRDPLAIADRWVAGVGRTGYVWEDGGEVVCFVGSSGETPNGVRIGPVYTPPGRRGHGYASSLTAAATHELLASSRRFVFLFTDLANPTSNKIYQAIGYRPVCDVDVYRLADADA